MYFYSPNGVLFVEGEDAATFLQGQFSQDLRISDKQVAYGLWLNSKGKVLADSFALRLSERSFLAISYSSKTALIRENLECRIIMDEVETRAPEGSWRGFSLWGASIGAALDRLGLEEPTEDGFSSSESVYAFWGRRGGDRNLEILVSDNEVADELRAFLGSSGGQLLDTRAVGAMALRSGRFEVPGDVWESDLPQEADLEKSAVSYGKGCYIGQEVMARLKAMGQARRALECVYVSRVPDGEAPWSLVDGAGKRVGELRRVLLGEGMIIGSAMLKRSRAEGPYEVDGQAQSIVTLLIEEGGPSE